MIFSIPQKELSIALARCAAIAASSRTSLPVLASVLLSPLAGCLKVCATDLEVGFTTIVDGLIWDDHEGFELPSPGVLLSAKTLHDCVKSIPSGEVRFEVSDNIAIISGGTAKFTLTGLDVAEFPVLDLEKVEGLTIDPTILGSTLKRVAYCQSKDETKPNLHGIFLRLETNQDGVLFIVASATDGHRLCLDENSATNDEEDTLESSGDIPEGLAKGIVIPMKGVTELIKLVGDGPAVISLAKNTLIVTTGDEILSIQLCELAFPDINRVIPQDQPHLVKVKRQSLIDALERCRIITHKDSRRVNLSAQDNGIAINSEIPIIGAAAADRISAEYLQEPPAISMNVEYLLQALGNMTGAEIELHLTDELTPMVINPAGTDFPQAIVMPMRM